MPIASDGPDGELQIAVKEAEKTAIRKTLSTLSFLVRFADEDWLKSVSDSIATLRQVLRRYPSPKERGEKRG